MRLIIQNTLKLNGTVLAPSSKSQSVRALFFALIANGTSTLKNVLNSDDVDDAMRVCKQLGASISADNNNLEIHSLGVPFKTTTDAIYTGNSGITTRFLLPLLGLRENTNVPIIVNCGDQMRTRPIKPLVDALIKFGMKINYLENDYQLPIQVSGNLIGGKTEIDGLTSQYLSSLLIALPYASSDSEIVVKNLHERPYVEMTLTWLKEQGIFFTHRQVGNVDSYYIRGNQFYSKFDANIAGDFSSASCLIAAGVLTQGYVELLGMNMQDPQGDKRLITLLQKMGATITVETNRLCIQGGEMLSGIKIDANDIPDLVPALAVVGTKAKGKTEIHNVKQARIKETDRIHSMTEGLRRMGAKIDEHEDGMTIYHSQLHGAHLNGYGDHRTVMALSVAGIIAEGTTTINDAEVVNKTFPGFIETMQSIDANLATHKTIENKHIIFIGFKHVGKTRIGKRLARILNRKLIDLDNQIETMFEMKYHEKLTCRQIMQSHGQSFFREFESTVLQHIINVDPCVISLGGGAPLNEANQHLIKQHVVINVLASRGVVFERIMVGGRPAFFDPEEDPYESFSRLWNERTAIYEKLTSLSVENNGSIDTVVNQVLNHLNILPGAHHD